MIGFTYNLKIDFGCHFGFRGASHFEFYYEKRHLGSVCVCVRGGGVITFLNVNIDNYLNHTKKKLVNIAHIYIYIYIFFFFFFF